ncbi:MAG TPA: YciI family protein [Kofleriaceae bacterium]
MPDYLMMISEHAATSPADAARRLGDHEAFAAEIAGTTLDRGRFRPRAEGKRVTRDGVSDGCFDATFDRYYWVCSEDAAFASALPLGPGEQVDCRPLIRGEPHADKLDHPGKVFAFLVSAHAASEAAWVETMETIAKETAQIFPAERFAGGLRLRAPSTGKHIVLDQTKRRVIDGPFLESKEVIGGMVLLRMTDLDEAIRWASASRFLAHGALEIRELWRM